MVLDEQSGARRRRERLRGVMDALEAAIAAPAPGREEMWRASVGAVLADLSAVLADHIAETDGPEAFLDRVVRDAPRLAHAVDVLRDDHHRLTESVDELRSRVGRDGAEDVRSAALDVLGLLARHRHRGADLLYEAYSMDLGAGD